MASVKVGNITFGAEELSKTFQTYRSDFLMMPLLALGALAEHCSVRTGIRYRETVGEMSGNLELSNYQKTKWQASTLTPSTRAFGALTLLRATA